MKPLLSLREALSDPRLLGGAIPGDSWRPWRTLLIAAMGEELTNDERALFTTLTGREREPLALVEELWGIVGRRSGKTRAAGTLAAYVGALCDHTEYLAPGERGVIPILAATADQAGRAFMHAKGVLEHSPDLADLIDGEPTLNTIRLTTSVDILVRPANFRTVRSITAVAAICDEVAFWMIEGTANPDAEILEALRPSLGTTGGPMMVISSAYAKRGEVYNTYRRDFGAAGDPLVMVAHAPTRTFNPTFPQAKIDRAIARDAEKARAEYLSVFRDDVSGFVNREVVEACVSAGVTERPFDPSHRYRAFVDPSGGSNDAMTLAVGHQVGDVVVLDALRERRPPFSPESVVADFAKTMQDYRISTVTGDRYAGEWPREAFRRHGISYELAEHTRSDLYRDMLPRLNSRRVDLLDSSTLVSQIAALERRVARGGKESIDHPPHGHDDIANAAAGVLSLFSKPQARALVVSLHQAFIGGTWDEMERRDRLGRRRR